MKELEALLILNALSHLGSLKIRFLIQQYGSALAALNTPSHELANYPGFGQKILKAWDERFNENLWKKELALANQLEASLIPFTSSRYPKRLLEIADYPVVLYTQGQLLDEDRRSLSIVGTRQTTIYGLEMARAISRDLAQAGFTIVSGLARGIDTAAHQGALDKGRTIAVLGSGLARLYPQENIDLAAAIRNRGALLSEFAMEAPPNHYHFPRRNRIVSAMTMGTILIEAPLESGAMLTIENAIKQGRPVFTLPGRVDQTSFKGNHALIKGGKAHLIENAEDILKHFDDLLLIPHHSSKDQRALFFLNQEEKEFLIKMPIQEISIEELVRQIKWPIAKLNSLLMNLVLKKMVKEYPGKVYKKLIS